MNSGLSPAPSAVGVPGVKLKFCRYYAKDKTCFYGDECQFLHEEPLGIHGNSLAIYPPPPVLPPGPKKVDLGALEGPRLSSDYVPGIDGALPGALSDTSLTDSYFSTSFIGMNGFGSPADVSYPRMQQMTNSSSSPSLLNDSAKPYAGHDPLGSASTMFNDFAALGISQRRKTPNPTASEFIPKGGSTSRLSNMSQSSMSAFSQALFSHPSLGGPNSAALAPA